MKEKIQVPYSTGREPSQLNTHYKICDTHFHIFDPVHFPYKESDTRNQPPATVDCYRLLMRRTGIERCVIVNPSCYGTNNDCTISALRQFGDCARAVAVIDDSITMDTLRTWDQFGVRGIRFNLVSGSEDMLNNALSLSEKIALLGWNTAFYMNPEVIIRFSKKLEQYPTTIVFDHMGHLPPDNGVRHEAYAFILSLLKSKKAYVKLSGFYLNSEQPDLGDTLAIGKSYIHDCPEGLVWGTDWPHHNRWIHQKPMPDDVYMLDSLMGNIPDEVRKMILCDNPAKLYDFAD